MRLILEITIHPPLVRHLDPTLVPRVYVLDYFLFRFFTGLPRYPIHDDFSTYDFIYLFVLQVLHSTVQFTLQRTATYIRDFTNLSYLLEVL